jgi:hypothetical protein
MFYYHPSVPQAYRDMKELEFVVDNGLFLRNMHRWAAHLMVFATFLHMMRVFFHRAYRPPRQFNWVIGVVLLIVTLLLSYTGYPAPWDQLAFWGVSVSTNAQAPLVGRRRAFRCSGNVVPGTPPSLYVLHCGRLPVALLSCFRAHLARPQGRRRAGTDRGAAAPSGGPMSSLPPIELIESADPLATPRRVALVRPDRRPAVRTTDEKYVMTFPNLIVREVVLFQLVVIGLALAAIVFDAPLEGIANPLETPNPAKAPWYFLVSRSCCTTSRPWSRGSDADARDRGARRHSHARINQTAGPLWAGAGPHRALALTGAAGAIVSLFGASDAGRSPCRRPGSPWRCSRPAEGRGPGRSAACLRR